MEILLWLRDRRNTQMKAVNARVTINKKRKDFATGISVHPDNWLGSDYMVNPITPEAIEQNQTLTQIKADIRKAYNLLKRDSEIINAHTVVEKYQELAGLLIKEQEKAKPIPTIYETLMLGMEDKRNQIGIKIKASSYRAYQNYYQNFLKYCQRFKVDIHKKPITDLDLDLCNDFIKRLVTHFGLEKSYANKHKEIIRIISNKAHYIAEGYTIKLITAHIDKHREKPPVIVNLSNKEIETIEKYPFVGKLAKARDILLILCDIGQHISDYLAIVKNGKIEVDDAGDSWINMFRIKTSVEHSILLSPRVLNLVEKYGGLSKLPTMSRQKLNDYLEVIAMYCNIDKDITSKVGRKSFGDKYLNEHKTELSMVATLLGLTSTKYIKNYVKYDKERLKEEYKKAM